ncbi:MAG: cysteine synthase family protein [Vampirovibrionales bacterium]|nr:cysteine synthase family protein [Vampirovibrionales bacterium]
MIPVCDFRSQVVDSILDTVGNTPMVRLKRMFAEFPETEVLAKIEFMNPNGSVKDRIAKAMIEDAEDRGLIKPGDTLIEPTSGNTGLGLAMAAAAKGYKLIITMPMKMSEEKRRLLRAFGAELILTPTECAYDHPDGAIELAKRLAQEKGYHILNQYYNPANPQAHFDATGPEIWEQTQGRIDYFVASMGTGGTISGTSKFLKSKDANIKTIGIDPEGSIFSGDTVKPYLVEGIGYDFWPGVLDTGVIDEMIRIGDKASFNEGRMLARLEGMLAGGSTGTVCAGVRQLLARPELKGKRVVMVLHDSGRSYLTKMYNDEWMRENGFLD